ncbi:condensation domain-containing protein [Micromonospora sp. FIMYZ51]|uniref:condensation domain-containing protein n=1 Tax=Micromonospora sp. FIMYZ51 TaxID=3051832 RepID=UPI00311D9800
MTPEQRRALRTTLDTRGEQLNVFPLSSAQQRMWFLHQVYRDLPLYTVPYAFWIVGRLDIGALSEALLGLVRRHDALRTAFFDVDGVPYQTVLPDSEFRLAVRHWRPQDAARRDLVERLLDAEARRTFDLTRGSLLSATILTSGDQGDRHLLLLTMHHIICDGWSMGIIFREIEEGYTAAIEGREPDLDPLPVRYVDFARWQATDAAGERYQRHLQYWQGELADPPAALTFPDRPPPSATGPSVGELELAFWPASLARSVEAVSRAEGVTPFITMLAVFADLLRRRTGADDFIVGTPVANRTRLEVEGLVGFFVNTLPLRLRPSGGESLRESLRKVRSVTLRAQTHQEVPFETIVESLGVPRTSGRNPLFEVSFIVQDRETELLRLPGLEVSITHGHSGTAKFDLAVGFVFLADELKCSIEYRRSVFDREYVRGLLDEMREHLEAALANPDRPMQLLKGRVPR